MSIYSESDRYMWVFCITYYLAETCLIRLKIVVNKNNNKKENRKGKIMDFIELLKVIFLGIVEGITEWLPISSTGHMILLDEFILRREVFLFVQRIELGLNVGTRGDIIAVIGAGPRKRRGDKEKQRREKKCKNRMLRAFGVQHSREYDVRNDRK